MQAKRASMSRIVQPLRGGQITIPAEFRKRLGIKPDTILRITLEGQGLRITPVNETETAGGSPWFRELYDYFAPVREETKHYSEEEINADIDAAIKAVREEHADRP